MESATYKAHSDKWIFLFSLKLFCSTVVHANVPERALSNMIYFPSQIVKKDFCLAWHLWQGSKAKLERRRLQIEKADTGRQVILLSKSGHSFFFRFMCGEIKLKKTFLVLNTCWAFLHADFERTSKETLWKYVVHVFSIRLHVLPN